MRIVSTLWAAATALLLVGAEQSAEAGLLGMPMGLRAAIQRIQFDTPTLAPMAYTLFCLQYTQECKPQKVGFRGGAVRLTSERWADLNEVNQRVNSSIRPQANTAGLAGDVWLINPAMGDCNDFAVTKRHELLARGWPARTLLLSEVITSSGQHHLVLVVRTRGGDVVLDNMTRDVRPWSRAPYHWVRMQLPGNSRLWTTIAPRSV